MKHHQNYLAGNVSIGLFFQVLLTVLFLTVLIHLFLPSPVLPSDEELGGQLNINTATTEELQQLPFIGENKAWTIVDYRLQHGPIKDLSILLETGIMGQCTYEAIKPYIKLSGPSRFQYIGRNKAGDQLLINTKTAGEGNSITHDINKLDTENVSAEGFLRGRRVLSTHKARNLVMTRPGEIRILPDKEYYKALLDAIQDARERIDMALFLFKITDSARNRPAKVLEKLIIARKRGVQIKVLLENSGYDEGINKENRRVAKKLRQNDIQVDFDSPRSTTHTKLVIIDQRYVFVGSHNMTHSALSGNHELSLLIDNRDVAEEMLDYLGGLSRQ